MKSVPIAPVSIFAGYGAAFALRRIGCVAGLAILTLHPAPEPAAQTAGNSPLLIVMTPTGGSRDGLPVYRPHPNGRAYVTLLSQGFAGTLLRLYRLEQQFLALRDGTIVEPAYLLVSRNEGGFPRYGFWLDDTPKRGAGYVDLHERLDGSGRFGALDQIFPHELMHVIVHQLAEPKPAGASGANQVHAIGVRTDRVTAFDEGFAEHAQVVAIDDPDARPLTAALRTNAAPAANAADRLRRYQRALDARWALAPPARLAFITWFSQTEQALRYHAVKANRFAHEPAIRLPRSGGDDLYAAYLLENILPGEQIAPVKSTPRLLASEGVIASLFWRWVTNPAMQHPAESSAFYARFGTRIEDLSPIGHAYLKLFAVLADRRPDGAAGLVRAYVETFPGETEAVATLMRQIGFVWPLPDVPEIWLANDDFMTGTTVFDQYRALPRVHTFDLNAASLIDLLTVPGLTKDLATSIQRGVPYASVADLERVPGVTRALIGRFQAMHEAMAAVRAANAAQDIEALDLARLVRPIIVRAVAWTLICAVAAAVLSRLVRPRRFWRVAVNGLAAATFGLLPAWVLGSALQYGDRPVDATLFVFLPALVFGVPAALWQLARRRATEAARDLLAWVLACLPAALIATPLL